MHYNHRRYLPCFMNAAFCNDVYLRAALIHCDTNAPPRALESYGASDCKALTKRLSVR
jgi:hypothetical protein